MAIVNMYSYPELARQSNAEVLSNFVAEFLESTSYVLAEWVNDGKNDRLMTVIKPVKEILLEYFEIDDDKVAAEKQALITLLQKED